MGSQDILIRWIYQQNVFQIVGSRQVAYTARAVSWSLQKNKTKLYCYFIGTFNYNQISAWNMNYVKIIQNSSKHNPVLATNAIIAGLKTWKLMSEYVASIFVQNLSNSAWIPEKDSELLANPVHGHIPSCLVVLEGYFLK